MDTPPTSRRHRGVRRAAALTLAVALFGALGSLGSTAGARSPAASARAALAGSPLARIGHVWVVVLENKSYAQTFGSPSAATSYLVSTLPAQGALLRRYYGIGHASLDNYLALLSGQGPTVATQADCPVYVPVLPGSLAGGLALGQGCVYPAPVATLANQLTAAGRTWKGYFEDMGATPGREQPRCGAPAASVANGWRDPTQSATPTDQYAARHNPFVYFAGVRDTPACAADVVPLGPPAASALAADDARAATTPAFSLVVPNLCNDGHDTPCVGPDITGATPGPGGLVSVDRWLRHYVPVITASPAFRSDGLLLITWDEAAATTGKDGVADASSCCGETNGPNTPRAGGPSTDLSVIGQTGGGRVGAIALSPFITPGTVTDVGYNHYSTLRSVEDIFGLAHLGMAAAGPASFGPDVFGAAGATPGPAAAATGPPGAAGPAAVAAPPAAGSAGALASTGGLSLAAAAGVLVVTGLLARRRAA